MLRSRSQGYSNSVGICISVALLAALVACGESGKHVEQLADTRDILDISPANGANKADPASPVTIKARGHSHRITDVTLADTLGRSVGGELMPDGATWRSRGSLAAGTAYTGQVSLTMADGRAGQGRFHFSTAPAQRLLRLTLGPGGGTFGVGQPVTARLSQPVSDLAARAVVERGLRVTSHPAVQGGWHWVNDHTLHYRPREYWPPHTRVQVENRLSGVRVHGDLYGAPGERMTFRTGDRVEAVVDAEEHMMTVFKNQHDIRTLPVTTGKPGFETRNGVKVILGKQPLVRMAGTSIGIPEGSPDSYDLQVYWATQVTLSGEYVHAAPWSEASQGVANVSHGCTGMSMEDAEWFYRLVRPGDIVRVIGSQGDPMAPFGNGFGDWNLSWEEWRAGSALYSAPQGDAGDQAAFSPQARLRPLQG